MRETAESGPGRSSRRMRAKVANIDVVLFSRRPAPDEGDCMRSSRAFLANSGRTVVDGLIALGIGLAFTVLPLVIVIWFLDSSSCTTQTRRTFYNMSGFNFVVSETDCDSMGRQTWISVLVARGGRAPKNLLLQYVPVEYDVPYPVVRQKGANAFRISVPAISTLMYRRDRWETLSIDYDIGDIDHPRN
jgi:hypothetical protein